MVCTEHPLLPSLAPSSSIPGLCGLALRKADGDETVQWPPWRSATRNDVAPAVFLTISPVLTPGPYQVFLTISP